MDDSTLLKAIVGLTAFIAMIFAVRKAFRMIFPIRVIPSIHFPSDAYKMGAIGADIVNKSNETQYIINCKAIGTYSLKHILLKHLNHPKTNPRLYRTIWYGVMTFPLIDNEKVRIEPFEPIHIKHVVADHPLSFFDTPKFLIEVELSSGRKIRSHRLDVPPFWHHSHRLKQQKSKTHNKSSNLTGAENAPSS